MGVVGPSVERSQMSRQYVPELMREIATQGTGAKELNRQLFIYNINMPFPYDSQVWRRAYRKQKEAIEQYDDSHPRQFFDVYPSLDLHEDTGDSTLGGAVAGMIAGLRQRFHIVHATIGMLVQAMLYLEIRGFPVASRLMSALKFSKLNSRTSLLADMYYNSNVVDYLLSQQRILTFPELLNGGQGIALPLYLPPQDNFVQFPKGNLDSTGPTYDTTRHIGTLGATQNNDYPTKRFPYLTEWQDDGAQSRYKEDTNTEGAPNMNGWNTNDGVFANYIYDRFNALVYDLVTNYSDVLDSSTQVSKYMQSVLGCTTKFDISDLSEKLRSVEPLDGKQFITDYMIYGSKLQAVYLPMGFSDGWDLDATDEADTLVTYVEDCLIDASDFAWGRNEYDAFSYLVLKLDADGTDKTNAFKSGQWSAYDAFIEDASDLTFYTPTDTDYATGCFAFWGEVSTYSLAAVGTVVLPMIADLMYYGRPSYLPSKDFIKTMIERAEVGGNRIWVDPIAIDDGAFTIHQLYRPILIHGIPFNVDSVWYYLMMISLNHGVQCYAILRMYTLIQPSQRSQTPECGKIQLHVLSLKMQFCG
jgi:hypothetical protein